MGLVLIFRAVFRIWRVAIPLTFPVSWVFFSTYGGSHYISQIEILLFASLSGPFDHTPPAPISIKCLAIGRFPP
ncbi:hypothetical protein F5Y14DRAFT_193956 [Nemania sp. NC0429]|nr:hypothetical protein F5Y14DRAFT_193956 [Nemania sp. NC0429]